MGTHVDLARVLRSAPLMAGLVVAPFVVAGYVGLAALLVLPLLALREMFPRRYTALMDGGAWR